MVQIRPRCPAPAAEAGLTALDRTVEMAGGCTCEESIAGPDDEIQGLTIVEDPNQAARVGRC